MGLNRPAPGVGPQRVLTGIQPITGHTPFPCPVIRQQHDNALHPDMYLNIGALTDAEVAGVCAVIAQQVGQDGNVLVHILTVKELNALCYLIRLAGNKSDNTSAVRGPFGLPNTGAITNNMQHRLLYTGRITGRIVDMVNDNRRFMQLRDLGQPNNVPRDYCNLEIFVFIILYVGILGALGLNITNAYYTPFLLCENVYSICNEFWINPLKTHAFVKVLLQSLLRAY